MICSWRVLRVQKKDSNEEPIQPCNDVAPVPSSSLPAPKNGWQENLWTFDLGEDADGGNCDNVDIEELSRALSEATSLTSSSKKQNCDPGASVKLSTTDQECKAHDKRFPGIASVFVLGNSILTLLHKHVSYLLGIMNYECNFQIEASSLCLPSRHIFV